MRTLWLVRENLTRHPGGDTTQILRSAAALRAWGVRVDLTSDPDPVFYGYDVVHLFHLDRVWEHQAPCRRIRAEGRPAVLSTIYWPADEFDHHGRAGVQGWLARRIGSGVYQNFRLAQRHALHLARLRTRGAWRGRWWGFAAAVRELLSTARVLLPNSQAEAEQIVGRFGVRRPIVVVPNAAEANTFGPPEEGEVAKRIGVLCVGRIEPRKNQLALIAALRGTDIPLTLVGQSGRFSASYARRCQHAAGANVRFMEPQRAPALCRLYQRARAHACVSWYETPGLASLEAGLCGCALIVTPGGCTREYFGGDAHYCQPDNLGSIRAAVEAALTSGPSDELNARIFERYTWEAAAEQTLAAYERAIAPASATAELAGLPWPA